MPQKHGHLANTQSAVAIKPCEVCGDAAPRYSWTDLNGEGYCCQCGTPYQLANGTLKPGESYPRINVKPEFIEALRAFWAERHITNGCGTFLIWRDYADQLAGRDQFNAWFMANRERFGFKP